MSNKIKESRIAASENISEIQEDTSKEHGRQENSRILNTEASERQYETTLKIIVEAIDHLDVNPRQAEEQPDLNQTSSEVGSTVQTVNEAHENELESFMKNWLLYFYLFVCLNAYLKPRRFLNIDPEEGREIKHVPSLIRQKLIGWIAFVCYFLPLTKDVDPTLYRSLRNKEFNGRNLPEYYNHLLKRYHKLCKEDVNTKDIYIKWTTFIGKMYRI